MKLAHSSPFIITSMHRSGSSLTASLLESAGLHLGRQLMAGNQSNVKGYFENLDFLDFHKAVLRSHEITDKGWTLQESIEVDDRFVDTAKEIVERNAIASNWGWKEPRTTLFLEFWGNLLPKAQFLFIYRAPWEVVDSLYRRREDKPFQRNPDMAIKLWLHYNHLILNFYNRFPHRCLLASIYSITESSSQYVDGINQKFDRDLNSPNPELYDAGLLSIQSAAEYRASLINHYFPEAIQLYRELDARAWYPENTPPLLWEEKLQATPYRVWALQDWADNCGLAFENTQLRSDRHESKLKIKQLEKELKAAKEKCDRMEKKQEKLDRTEELLQQSQTQLQQMETVLEATQSVLKKTETQLEGQQENLEQQAVALQRWELREKIGRETNDRNQTEYRILVWDAWRAYGDRNFEEMVCCLQKSIEYSSVSRSELILNWLEYFTYFSQEARISFNIESLVSSESWQRLLGLMRVSCH
ncbi:sulfotransferase [Oscillatoriales cyanobacterium LEGE 11467]|uniref:Sulfotransferase n=1 Tax=Zarconia navalis LEGE 11467 TaxID=1828826 RepID=A0A928VUS0_9CYAN|nr:hypothetical protein [Zarconia navalis]MBE9040714.1 sulfotransferase [Zarconia navalis LEGE 11467]